MKRQLEAFTKSKAVQVEELMGVLEEGGPALLEGYPLQGLSWEQVKQLKGPNLVGLGMGPGPAPGICLTLLLCSGSALPCCC